MIKKNYRNKLERKMIKKNYMKIWLKKNKNYHKEWHIKNRIRENERSKNWRKNNPNKLVKLVKRWRKNNPLKYKNIIKRYSNRVDVKIKRRARDKTRRIRPKGMCEECHKNLAVHKHHMNYSNPFQLKFVCKGCHYKLHRSKKWN